MQQQERRADLPGVFNHKLSWTLSIPGL
jgi:hypothetical protein